MYNSFLYVISNEGVDTSNSYPFAEKVGRLCQSALKFVHGRGSKLARALG